MNLYALLAIAVIGTLAGCLLIMIGVGRERGCTTGLVAALAFTLLFNLLIFASRHA